MKKFYTRQEIQETLDKNPLNAIVTYDDREDGTPDNFIVYFRLSPSSSVYSDDKIHIRKATIQVSHYHKKKLDSIEEFMIDEFNIEPEVFDFKDSNSDYLATHYRFEIFTKGVW